MHKKKLKRATGFTLIEMMVVAAIIGILAAVSVPAYQNYIIRGQISEGLGLASGAKPFVAEYHANHGEFPASMADTGYTGALGKYISSTEIRDDGAIIATLGGDANSKISGKTITLTPKVEDAGNLSWDCSSTAQATYLPTSCGYLEEHPPIFTGDFSNYVGGQLKFTGPDPVTHRPPIVTTYVDPTSVDADGTQHFFYNGHGIDITPDGHMIIAYTLSYSDCSSGTCISSDPIQTFSVYNAADATENSRAYNLPVVSVDDESGNKIYYYQLANFAGSANDISNQLFALGDAGAALKNSLGDLYNSTVSATSNADKLAVLRNYQAQAAAFKAANGGTYPDWFPESFREVAEGTMPDSVMKYVNGDKKLLTQ